MELVYQYRTAIAHIKVVNIRQVLAFLKMINATTVIVLMENCHVQIMFVQWVHDGQNGLIGECVMQHVVLELKSDIEHVFIQHSSRTLAAAMDQVL